MTQSTTTNYMPNYTLNDEDMDEADRLFNHQVKKMKAKLVPDKMPASSAEMMHKYVEVKSENMLGLPVQDKLYS